jgi:hypothetical protein
MKAKKTNGLEHALGGLVDVLMEIGQERVEILTAMKAALVRDDEEEALKRARELTGLPTKRTTCSMTGHRLPDVLP